MELDVHFLVGGTQANLTVIDAALRPHQGALCAVSGHINVHETGAVEATGHKVLALPSDDGKITGQQVREYVEAHRNDPDAEHTVQPKLVYISNPTEIGTIEKADPNSPQTGDNTNLTWWWLLLILSATCIVVLETLSRKKKA